MLEIATHSNGCDNSQVVVFSSNRTLNVDAAIIHANLATRKAANGFFSRMPFFVADAI